MKCFNKFLLSSTGKGVDGKLTKEYIHSAKGRDSNLFLFHALGKILYCKREETNPANKETAIIQEPTGELFRKPLKENPEVSK